MNKCGYCGWIDNDPSFFEYYAGKNYCSLHKQGKVQLCGDHLIPVNECGCM